MIVAIAFVIMAVLVMIVVGIVVVVIVLLMGVPFDDTGQRLALDRHLETSANFVGAKQQVGELFVDDREMRDARFRNDGKGFEYEVVKLPVLDAILTGLPGLRPRVSASPSLSSA